MGSWAAGGNVTFCLPRSTRCIPDRLAFRIPVSYIQHHGDPNVYRTFRRGARRDRDRVEDLQISEKLLLLRQLWL